MKIRLIAQKVDIFPGDGKHPFARTGEISFYHLKKAGAQGVILGHSEVNEPPENVNQKLIAAFNEGLKDNVVLLGENWKDLGKSWNELSENKKEKVKKIVQEKFLKILKNIDKKIALTTIFGYEPGWAVRGSGKRDIPPPRSSQIRALAGGLREVLSKLYSKKLAQQIRIVYGGSSSPERIKEIISIEDIDGLILGSAATILDWVKKIGNSIIKITQTKKSKRKPVLILNWKAYILKEPYEEFLKIVDPFGEELDIYFVPPATDLFRLKKIIKRSE